MSLLSKPCVIRCSFQCLIVILVGYMLMTAVLYHTREDRRFQNNIDFTREDRRFQNNIYFTRKDRRFQNNIDFTLIDETSYLPSKKNETSYPVRTSSQCDFFAGKWVLDKNSYPLYIGKQCGFMYDDFACEKYGRKDLEYQKWRWQPHNCDLPRFNATKLLEILRDKRLVFVGDSVNRNQWVSLMCMLEGSIPAAYKYKKSNGNLYTFRATEYNTTIDFYWAPLLVESKSDDPSNHNLLNRVIRVDSIEKHAIHWDDADVLVFNSYLWWRIPKLKVVWGSLENPRKIRKIRNQRSYEMALKTWSDWMTTNVNRTKTKLFFVSMPATHHQGGDWGKRRDQNCWKETEPISQKGYRGSGSDPKMMSILDAAIHNLKTKGMNVRILNITQLSEYRKDAHPTIYRKQWRPLTKEQISNPLSYADCTHWCLPGVPDVWNELLYAYLVDY